MRHSEGERPRSPSLSATPPVLVAPDRPLEEALRTFWLLALLRCWDYGSAGTQASAMHPMGWRDAWVRLGRN